jgi:N-acetylmuramic acid 6-phosphate etherase
VRGAEELAAAVFAAARQLHLDRTPLPLALAGGVLLASRSYQAKVRTALAQRGLVTEPVTLVREPAEGALRLAIGTT